MTIHIGAGKLGLKLNIFKLGVDKTYDIRLVSDQ